MFHTDDEFLRAIEQQPAERTLRLVYADWLDEHNDPRGELIRVEEEMRTVPVFADRFWELKPRRNTLRVTAGAEWCGRMRYGTECEPVFLHGIPDGWRERWRLIREFTERWHRIPMGDVGGRQKEIAEAERRLGKVLPPSVHEWVAFECDAQDSMPPDPNPVFWWQRLELYNVRNIKDILLMTQPELGIRAQYLNTPDPPVYLYASGEDLELLVPATDEPAMPSVTELALQMLLPGPGVYGDYMFPLEDGVAGQIVESFLPLVARSSRLTIHEASNMVAVFDRQGEPLQEAYLWLEIHSTVDRNRLPTPFRDLIEDQDRRDAAAGGDPIPF